VYIHETQYDNIEQLKIFDSKHSGHPVQVVNEEEIDKGQWTRVS